MTIDVGAVKPHVQTAADEINTTFPGLVIGGWRATGSVPGSDHPKGLALDVMTSSSATGNKIAEWAIANAARLGVTYVIWNRRIWQDGTWKGYTGPSPHTDHVHISFSGSGTSNLTGTGALGNNSGCNPLALLILFSFKMLKWGGIVYGAYLYGGII